MTLAFVALSEAFWLCIYVFVHIFLYIHAHVCIYIYTHRERESSKKFGLLQVVDESWSCFLLNELNHPNG